MDSKHFLATSSPAPSTSTDLYASPRPVTSETSPSVMTSGGRSEPAARERRKRTKRRLQGEKECRVCGDKAIAHNFGALTCETCKAFFRRNANRTQEIAACAFESKCVINKTTRRFCPSCRMDKCFAVGMDPSLILDDEEKEAMRERRLKRKRDERDQDHGTYHMEVDSSTSNLLPTPSRSPPPLLHSPSSLFHAHLTPSSVSATTTSSDSNLLGSLSPISAAISNFYQLEFSTSSFGPDSSELLGTSAAAAAADPAPASISSRSDNELMNRVAGGSASPKDYRVGGSNPTKNYTVENEACEGNSTGFSNLSTSDLSSSRLCCFCAQGQEEPNKGFAQGVAFKHVEREDLPWDIQLYWPLTADERTLLTLLANCYQNIQIAVHQRPADDPPPPPPANHPLGVENLMYILDATLRRCVSFAKLVPDFRTLREVDQIACLKASSLQTYTLRSAALYILERKAWHTYLGDVSFLDLQSKFQENESVRMFADYCAALKSVARTNSTLYALLHCLALFDARDAKLEERVKVNALKDKYVVLLKHYLESEFSYRHSGRYLVEIMALLEDVHRLKNKVMGFYSQFSHSFRPLVAEFFAT